MGQMRPWGSQKLRARPHPLIQRAPEIDPCVETQKRRILEGTVSIPSTPNARSRVSQPISRSFRKLFPWSHRGESEISKASSLLTTLGIPKCGFHAFRHGNATLLDQIGAPMAVRLNRLGHSEARTTMGYTHAVTADERSTADNLGRILHGTARNEQEKEPAQKAQTLLIQ